MFLKAILLCMTAGVISGQPSDSADVIVVLAHTFGGPILAKLQAVEMIRQHPSRTPNASVIDLKGTMRASIPYGEYRLRVRAEGFLEYVSTVQVNRPVVVFPVGLNLAPIENTGIPEHIVTARGYVVEMARSVTWGRLLGKHVDVHTTFQVMHDGSFSIPEVRKGHYMLLMYAGHELFGCATLSVRNSEKQPVRLGQCP